MRLAVVGTSCCGKSVLAQRVAEKLGIKHIEQDRLIWRPNWEKVPREEYQPLLVQECAAESWTMSGNFSLRVDDLWKPVTHVVWLNYPLAVVLFRWLKRTSRRILLREECCNGNYESIKSSFLEKDSLIWWIFRTHWRRRAQYSAMRSDPRLANVEFLEFRHPRDAERWLGELGR